MLPSLDIAFYSFLSILHLFFLAPWMVSENLLAQMCGIQMHVYFRCAKVFVPKHLLYCTQVGTALNQMGGKTRLRQSCGISVQRRASNEG